MTGTIREFAIAAGIDELGEREEFSWDLIPVVSPEATLHLDINGLPKIGASINPGMILVGKIGKSKAYASDRKPTSLEIHSLSFEELHQMFGHLWTDVSLRLPEDFGCSVEVIEAKLEQSDSGEHRATVQVRLL